MPHVPNPAQLRTMARALAQRSPFDMTAHKVEYRARSLSERLNGTFAEVAAQPNPGRAYKPTHGGYPG